MTEELVIREMRIDEATDSGMTSFEVIITFKLQSTEILIYSICYRMKSVFHYRISKHNRNDENGHLSFEIGHIKQLTLSLCLFPSVDLLVLSTPGNLNRFRCRFTLKRVTFTGVDR